jgi:hypothetical protein
MKNRKLSGVVTLCMSVAFLTITGLLVWVQPAAAVDNGPTDVGNYCMQTLYGLPITNSNAINCTANDVKISRAKSVSPETCTVGETFTLEGTFEINVTSNERFRPGFFFRVDGGPTARGATLANPTDYGTCSLSRLDPTIPPALNLNGDNAGDLNSGVYEVTFTIPNVECQDSDGDGFLNLPNCTSWGNNSNELIDINDEFDFAPYNKSKCVCDDTFNVPVIVETASVTVTKTGQPESVPETGGAVTMTTTVTNDASFVDLTIDTITDLVGGVLTDLTTIPDCSGSGATASQPYCTPSGMTSCPSLLGTTLAPGATATCYFSAWVQADFDESPVIDTVEWCGTDSAGHSGLCDVDDEDTAINDVSPVPTLDKAAISAAECTMVVNYTVVVSNPSTSIDALTINGLTDDKFGDLTSTHAAGGGFEEVTATTCGSAVDTVLDPGETYPCAFTGRVVDSDCSINHTNKATASMVDDDGVPSAPFDTANVTIGPPTFP